MFADCSGIDYEAREDVVEEQKDCVGGKKRLGDDDSTDRTMLAQHTGKGMGTYRLKFVPSIERILCRECWRHSPLSTARANRFVHSAWDCVYMPWRRIRFVLLQWVLRFL